MLKKDKICKYCSCEITDENTLGYLRRGSGYSNTRICYTCWSKDNIDKFHTSALRWNNRITIQLQEERENLHKDALLINNCLDAITLDENGDGSVTINTENVGTITFIMDYNKAIELAYTGHPFRCYNYKTGSKVIQYIKHRGEFLHGLICPPVKTKDVTDHINKNTFDNRSCNLRSVSRSVNAKNSDAIRKGGYNYKEVEQYSLDGRFISRYPNMCDAGRKNGVHHGGVGQCCRGILKTSGGFIWKYV